MNLLLQRPISVRAIHAGGCVLLLAFVSWALLSPDPFSVVQDGPLGILAHMDDLIQHLGVYAVFSTACLTLFAESNRRRATGIVIALLCLHATGTEFLQSFVVGRTCDPFDAAANLVGISLGFLGTRLVSSRLRIRRLRRRIVPASA